MTTLSSRQFGLEFINPILSVRRDETANDGRRAATIGSVQFGSVRDDDTRIHGRVDRRRGTETGGCEEVLGQHIQRTTICADADTDADDAFNERRVADGDEHRI